MSSVQNQETIWTTDINTPLVVPEEKSEYAERILLYKEKILMGSMTEEESLAMWKDLMYIVADSNNPAVYRELYHTSTRYIHDTSGALDKAKWDAVKHAPYCLFGKHFFFRDGHEFDDRTVWINKEEAKKLQEQTFEKMLKIEDAERIEKIKQATEAEFYRREQAYTNAQRITSGAESQLQSAQQSVLKRESTITYCKKRLLEESQTLELQTVKMQKIQEEKDKHCKVFQDAIIFEVTKKAIDALIGETRKELDYFSSNIKFFTKKIADEETNMKNALESIPKLEKNILKCKEEEVDACSQRFSVISEKLCCFALGESVKNAHGESVKNAHINQLPEHVKDMIMRFASPWCS